MARPPGRSAAAGRPVPRPGPSATLGGRWTPGTGGRARLAQATRCTARRLLAGGVAGRGSGGRLLARGPLDPVRSRAGSPAAPRSSRRNCSRARPGARCRRRTRPRARCRRRSRPRRRRSRHRQAPSSASGHGAAAGGGRGAGARHHVRPGVSRRRAGRISVRASPAARPGGADPRPPAKHDLPEGRPRRASSDSSARIGAERSEARVPATGRIPSGSQTFSPDSKPSRSHPSNGSGPPFGGRLSDMSSSGTP